MYDQKGIYKNIQDPQELYNSLRYYTGPDKTLWTTQPKKTIQDLARPYRAKENNTITQQYNTLKTV